MQRLIWFIVTILIWFTITVLLLSLVGPTLGIIGYSLADTAAALKSPSFPDYTRIVIEADLLLSLVGGLGCAFTLANLAYDIYSRKKNIKGFIAGLSLGVILIISAVYVLQLIASTCFTMQGLVPGLYSETRLLYCSAANIDNAVAMTHIFHEIIWLNLIIGISLIVGSLMMIVFNIVYFRVKPVCT